MPTDSNLSDDLRSVVDRLSIFSGEKLTLLDSIILPIVIVLFDASGTIVYANPAAHELFGYPPKGLEWRSVDFLVPEDKRILHGQNRAYFSRSSSNIREMSNVALKAQKFNGDTVSVRVSLIPTRMEKYDCVVALVWPDGQ